MENLEKTFEDVFYTVTGDLEVGLPWVEGVAGSAEAYEQAYQDIDDARAHLCQRFGMDWEDPDLEKILSAISRLERDVGRRMFLCGVHCGEFVE